MANSTLIKKVFKNWIFLIGFVLFLVGTGPLLLTIIAAELGMTSDPNPNPVGFGILMTFTLMPSLVLMMIGFFRVKHSREHDA